MFCFVVSILNSLFVGLGVGVGVELTGRAAAALSSSSNISILFKSIDFAFILCWLFKDVWNITAFPILPVVDEPISLITSTLVTNSSDCKTISVLGIELVTFEPCNTFVWSDNSNSIPFIRVLDIHAVILEIFLSGIKNVFVFKALFNVCVCVFKLFFWKGVELTILDK